MTPPPAQPIAPKRSILDLRDPFERPLPRARSSDEHALAQQRLLMPDLKDPFADGVRRVRSRKLDLQVPSDIRDPFREGARPRTNRCATITSDGTPVQRPGGGQGETCERAPLDLRDPFQTGTQRPPSN
ncbi:MAG: hypothetical protein HC927_01635, partial [Deltaproteobacteria bacterium]|nr:hypothetical protein [Deltaproteobacteria bacterium]